MKAIVLAACAAAFMAGCASVKTAELAQLPTVKDDQALVYVYRESAFVGGGVSYDVYLGEKKVGGLTNGSFFFVDVPPGEHRFWAKTEAEDDVTIHAEAGKTYYIQGEVDMGVLVGQPDLTEVAAATGSAAIAEGLDYVVLTD